jgi:membrane-bound serine protease (ClpP class)
VALSALLLIVAAVLQGLGVAFAQGPAAHAPYDPDALDPAARPARRPGVPVLGDGGGAVLVIPIDGTIDLGLAPFVSRAIAEHPDIDAVILDINTFGGRVDAAVQIRDAVLATEAPVVAWVHPRAISAGALISLASDTLVFSPGGSMGAATPIQVDGGEAVAVGEKMTSYMRTEMRTTAEATDRNGLLAEAMVDRTIVVPGVIDGEKLLTASTDLAVRVGLADGVAADLDDLLGQLGLSGAEVTTASASWSEDLARILTEPTLSGLLMSLGFLGIMVELYTPGFGWAGGVGVICLATFFAGHMVADLAGWEEVMLLTVGVVALLVEVFVIPGFGVVGVVGLALIIAGLALSLTGLPLDVSWDSGGLFDALQRVVMSLTGAVVGLVVLAQFIPVRMLPSWLVLRATIGEQHEAVGDPDFHAAPSRAELVGLSGVAETTLRPSGKARIRGALVDVVSESAFIQPGTPITVLAVEDMRVVVAASGPAPAQSPGGGGDPGQAEGAGV